jgi:hypothetical protein
VKTSKLMRTTYKTDVTESEPEYIGSFSALFPTPAERDVEIVNVDWSVRGEVEVTYLIKADWPYN